MTVTLPKVYGDIIEHSTHILTAGATGSGKSVTLHGLISWLLTTDCDLAFIDLKKVEMIDYKPISSAYADTAAGAMKLLSDLVRRMDKRYTLMKRRKLKAWEGRPLYLIIDEYAELLINTKKQCIPLVQSIAQLGRACGIHLIMATQAPLASILSTPIKLNFDGLLALRTRSAQDSRNIIGVAGAEKLPRYGEGIFICPSLLQPLRLKLPKVDEETRKALIKVR